MDEVTCCGPRRVLLSQTDKPRVASPIRMGWSTRIWSMRRLRRSELFAGIHAPDQRCPFGML